jgi:hypothetical protein
MRIIEEKVAALQSSPSSATQENNMRLANVFRHELEIDASHFFFNHFSWVTDPSLVLMCLLGITFDVFRSLFFLVGLRKKGSAFFTIARKLYSCRCKTLPGMRYSAVWSRTSHLGLHRLVEREYVVCIVCRGMSLQHVSESKTSMLLLLPFLYCGYEVPSTVAD